MSNTQPQVHGLTPELLNREIGIFFQRQKDGYNEPYTFEYTDEEGEMLCYSISYFHDIKTQGTLLMLRLLNTPVYDKDGYFALEEGIDYVFFNAGGGQYIEDDVAKDLRRPEGTPVGQKPQPEGEEEEEEGEKKPSMDVNEVLKEDIVAGEKDDEQIAKEYSKDEIVALAKSLEIATGRKKETTLIGEIREVLSEK